MLQFFLNPWLLTGLAGIALPVVVHLLVRRRYRVVDWGAMQFLNPGMRTRRRLQLQDVFLLLLRILLVALLVFALARPWIRGGLLTGYQSVGSRDVVIIIDSSSSMARPDGISTLHQSAMRRATEFLATLSPQDTVMLIEARDEPTALLPSPLTDRSLIAERLNQLDPPAGFADLHAACERAAGLLMQTSHQHRDIVVFTDAQSAGWQPDRPALWEQFDDLLTFTTVRPQLWVMDCSSRLGPSQNLISMGRLTLEPPVAVPDGQIAITASVTSHSSSPLEVPVRLLVEGQRVPGQERIVPIEAGGSSTVEFVCRLTSGSVEELSVEADLPGDELTVDNVSHAIALTRTAPHVLLIDSSGLAAAGRPSTFFAAAALTPPADMQPWVRTQVVYGDRLTQDDVDAADVIICADVNRLPAGAPQWLEAAVQRGTGLLIATGRRTTAAGFSRIYADTGLLPGIRLTSPESTDEATGEPLQILPSSLQADWLQRIGERPDSSFLKAVIHSWWTLRREVVADSESDDPSGASLSVPEAVVRLTNQAPLLLEHHHGRGHVLLLTTSLDMEWSNLPGRPDFVAFLYEAVFRLAPPLARRNTLAGEPLVTQLETEESADLCVERPTGERSDVRSSLVRATGNDTPRIQVRYDRAVMPGLYRLLNQQTNERLDAFAVDYDRRENSVEQLSEADLGLLQESDRMVFTDSLSSLQQVMYGSESMAEIWWLLLWLFLLLLVAESWVTRRLVIQRHGLEGRPDSGNESVEAAPS